MDDEFVKVGEGPGKIVNTENVSNKFERLGYTNPDLYRKVAPKLRSAPEVAPRDYNLGIYNKDSILTTYIITHDEESTTSEIP